MKIKTLRIPDKDFMGDISFHGTFIDSTAHLSLKALTRSNTVRKLSMLVSVRFCERQRGLHAPHRGGHIPQRESRMEIEYE